MRVADRLDRLPLCGFHYRLPLLSGLGWLRGTGTGFAAAFGRIGGILALRAVGKLMGNRGGGFAAVLAMGPVSIVVLGEETRGRTLEEISG